MAYNYICIDRGRALHVDLYLLLRDPNEYRVVVTGIVAHFPLNHFDTLDELQFVGKKFLVPHDVHKHLEYNYGSTYLTPEQKSITLITIGQKSITLNRLCILILLKLYGE